MKDEDLSIENYSDFVVTVFRQIEKDTLRAPLLMKSSGS